ncbi:MAG TPA: VTT domain-containing protein [Solirubrobacteraceae bacterium]|nr:VTT domain-containing protein [Solirubrobacteraceae bacterium]
MLNGMKDRVRDAQGADSGPGADGGRESVRRRELALSLAGVIAGAGIIVAVPDLRHAVGHALSGDLGGLRHEFRDLGAEGVALLLALMLAHAVLFYPTEIVTATAGFVYGFLPGLALAVGGWLVSGLLAYALGWSIGQPLIRVIFGARRFAELERLVQRGGATLLLALRLIPIVPFSLTGYVAGAARVRLWRFAWTTAVGYLPLTVIVTYLGSQAKSLSASDPRVWIAAAALAALLAVARFVSIERLGSQED